MKILTLMGGGKFETKKGNSYPVYMSEVNEKMILEDHFHFCQQMKPTGIGFCVKSSDITNYRVDNVINQLSETNVTFSIQNATRGALCTALLAYDFINNDEELLITAVNDFIEVPGDHILKQFRENNKDAGVVYFESVHPRYSFIKINDSGNVIQTAEKIPISRNALASFYYFKTGKSFISAAKSAIRKDNLIDGNFYISQSINELILDQKAIGCYQIKSSQFHPLKSKLELARYILRVQESDKEK